MTKRRTKNKPSYGSQGVHDGLVRSLEQRLKDSDTHYHTITKEKDFTNFKGKHGEVDLFALYDAPNGLRYMLVFEMKSTKHPKAVIKSHQQEIKDRAYFSKVYNVDRTFMFSVYSGENKPLVEWYRK